MSRVLLATLGSLGDLHPLIGIGLELRQRGHTILFATSASYKARIESLGFGFRPLRPEIGVESATMAPVIAEIMDPKKGVERLLRGYVLPALRATYDDLTSALAADGGADLLVSGELVYAAPLAAEKTGVRWASHSTAPMSFFSAYDPPVLPPGPGLSRLLRPLGLRVNQGIIRLIKSVTRAWSQPVRELRAQLGLPPGKDPIYEGKYSPQLVLATFSSVLARPQPDWPANTVVTGFPFYDGQQNDSGLTPELTKFLDAGEPPIVFTLGSAAVLDPGNFYQESAEAARLLKARAILLVGRNAPPARLPENVVAFGYVPFSQLFPCAAAVVHQGGVGTTGEALRAGCPMLVMPYNYDQPDNAARVARLGVSRTISRSNYSGKTAARALRALLAEPEYRRQALAISKRVRAEEGAQTAVAAIDRLLGSAL